MKHDLFNIEKSDIPGVIGLGALAFAVGVVGYLWLCSILSIAP